jgi:surface carbohydrate biosynthesis protein
MMEVDVLYFIEHVARELDIACVIKALLEERGISVVVKSIAHDLENTVSQYQPEVVILPYCNGVVNRPPEKMIPYWPQAKYLSLTFEQVLGKAQLAYIQEKDAFTRKFLFYSVWGGFYQQILEETGVEASNIRVNGSPTLNLYRPPYRFYYPQGKSALAEIYNLNPYKRWVFIPGNYGWAFFPDKLVRDRIRRGFNPDHAYRYRVFSRSSLERTAAWWSNPDLDDVVLIVRPRPATPEKDFRDMLGSFGISIPAHMHIIKDGTVREWIMASDIVMSSFSTTLIEAAVADKPIYMLTPVPLPDFIYSDWYDYVEKIESLEAFTRVCTAPVLESNWDRLGSWIDQTLLSGSDAIQNIVGTIQDLLEKSISLRPPVEIANKLASPGFHTIYRKSRKRAWKVYQGLVNLLGFQTPEQMRQVHEKDYLSADTINDNVNRWKNVLKKQKKMNTSDSEDS